MGNIIPATTGAAQAVVRVLPELAGKFHGKSLLQRPVSRLIVVHLLLLLSPLPEYGLSIHNHI